jgi:cell division transport system permease protein
MSNQKTATGYYPYFNVVFTMTIALFVLGFFLTVIMLVQSLLEKRRNELEVQVMLVGEKTESEVEQIKKRIATKPFVDANRIRFVHKDSSALLLMKTDQKDFIKILGINPLKDALRVGIRPEFDSKTHMDSIKTELSKLAGVYEVELPLAQIEEIHLAVGKLGFFVAAMVVLFLLITIFLINNAVKLALFSQRFLIRSMKLVGATHSFISAPFVKRGALQGLLAGGLAGFFLLALILYFMIYYPEIHSIMNYFRLFMIVLIELSVGVAVGLLATWFSVNKFLSMELDELY